LIKVKNGCRSEAKIGMQQSTWKCCSFIIYLISIFGSSYGKRKMECGRLESAHLDP